jgi:hypothetical protein
MGTDKRLYEFYPRENEAISTAIYLPAINLLSQKKEIAAIIPLI